MLFSDRWRGLKMALALAALVGLGVGYAHQLSATPIGWQQYTIDPHQNDGRPLLFPLYTVSAIENPHRYKISKVLRDIPVEGDTATLTVGDTLSVRATFRAHDQVAVEQSRQHHRLRPHKKLLSALALVWAIGMAPRVLWWGAGGLRARG